MKSGVEPQTLLKFVLKRDVGKQFEGRKLVIKYKNGKTIEGTI
jgi:hypothetical protein